jgi:hypothetical protein
MTIYIVCEGTLDTQFLKNLIPKELIENVEIIAAGGLSAAKSLARSLIVRRQSPVVIVADADTVNPDQVEQRFQETEEILGKIAANTPVKVILAVPTFEIIFFQDISLLSRLLGYVPPQDLLELAKYQPSHVLKQLLSKSHHLQLQSLLNQLTDKDLEILRNAPFIKDLIQFLQAVQLTATV